MGTTRQKLQAILDSKADIKDAIEQKGVTVGSTPLSGYAQKILDIPSGGGGEDEPYTDDAVRFFDYDGKQLLGMSKEDFLALDAMPANPATHEELVFTEWSHTLAEVKNYVSKYDYCDIMALYDTVDGKTRVTVRVDADNMMQIKAGGWPYELNIDWGDGQEETMTGSANVDTFTHIYSVGGDYTIIIEVVKGYLGYGYSIVGATGGDYPLANNCVNKIIKVHYGSNGTGNLKAAKGKRLLWQTGLTTTNAVQGESPINIKALFVSFYAYDLWSNCYNARVIVFKEGLPGLNYSPINNCYMADRVLLPTGQTNIVSNFANQCNSARHIVIPDGVTIANSEAFGYCYNCETLYLSKDLTSIGNNAFAKCIKLRELHLPEGLLTIGNGAFWICRELSEVTIPSTITSIGNSAFSMRYESNYKLTDVYVKPTTPPTLGTTVFPTSGITIHVPQGTLATYQAATNWNAYSSLMIDDIV